MYIHTYSHTHILIHPLPLGVHLLPPWKRLCNSSVPSEIPFHCLSARKRNHAPSNYRRTFNPGSTVLDVMQQAVGIDGQPPSAFKFSATNFRGLQLGFFIYTIGGHQYRELH